MIDSSDFLNCFHLISATDRININEIKIFGTILKDIIKLFAEYPISNPINYIYFMGMLHFFKF